MGVILWPVRALAFIIIGVVYGILSWVYKIFFIIGQLNYSSLEEILSKLTNKIEAVILVIIFLKVAMLLIQMMLKPEEMQKTGSTLIKNIFIVGAMLISYNLVFDVLNELSMLIIGAPKGYTYTALSRIAGVTSDEEDRGLINRIIFGEDSNEDIKNMGDYIAYETLSSFIRDADDNSKSEELKKAICSPSADSCDNYVFGKLITLASKIGKTIEYTPLFSTAIAAYIIYCVGTMCFELGIRMFKLMVLQIIAPLAIISRLDEKSKVFSQFVKTYTGTYVSAFIRIISLLAMNVMASDILLNFNVLFGDAVDSVDWFTVAILKLVVIVAGYSFVRKLPEFIKEVTGLDIGGSGKEGLKSFGNLIGAAAGIGIGAGTGIASSIKSKAGFSGGVANTLAGAWNGGAAGLKGKNIAEKFKGFQTTAQNNSNRADYFNRTGGGWAALGAAGQNLLGMRANDDAKMRRFDDASNAVKAYEKAQLEAIKDGKASSILGFDSGVSAVSYGEDKDAYANKVLEYNDSYIAAKAKVEKEKQGGDAAAIETAEKDFIAARDAAVKAAKDEFERAKDSATDPNITAKKAAAESALKKAGVTVQRNGSGGIDVKATNKEITREKHELENNQGYGRRHASQNK